MIMGGEIDDGIESNDFEKTKKERKKEDESILKRRMLNFIRILKEKG